MELIDLYIDPDHEDKSGVTATAVVDTPAIDSGFIAFKSNKPEPKKHIIKVEFKRGEAMAVEGDQQTLFGAFMIPGIKILRIDEATGKKYNVRFRKETIKAIVEKWALSNINTSINEMHNSNMPLNAGVIQHFIIDSKNGVNAPFNMKLPDGTWAGYVKVLDKQKWDTFIKTGIYTGFSVEGFFYEQPANDSQHGKDTINEDMINDLLAEILSH